MQVLSVCATKGGAGKTTIATALSVAATNDGQSVALIDFDPQQSMRVWWEDRGKPDQPQLVTWDTKLGVKYLPSALAEVEKHGFDLVIIDTPPAIMGIIEIAVDHADYVLIPTQASSADLLGNKDVIDMVTEAQKPFGFVINRAEPRDSLVAETQQFLQEYGTVLKPAIGNRKSYRVAIGDGKTGPEIEKKKAGEEISALWRALKKHLKAQARKVA